MLSGSIRCDREAVVRSWGSRSWSTRLPKGGSELLLEFETGERRLFDAAPFIDCGGSYGRLAEERYFAQVRIIDGGLALGWPEGQEVYPEALYEFSTPVG